MTSRTIRLPDGSRSTQSPWVWRGFLFMSLIGFGLFLSFVVGRHVYYAVAWGVITAGWFTIAMWLWRRHIRDDDQAWSAPSAASTTVAAKSSTRTAATASATRVRRR